MEYFDSSLNLMTYDEILQDMIDVFNSQDSHATDINTVGSVQRTYLEAVALQVFKLHNRQRKLMSRPFIISATCKDLDDLAAGFRLKRRSSSKASGAVTFFRNTSNQPVLVPAGTKVTRPQVGATPEMVYTTQKDIFMAIGISTKSVDVEAQVPGELGNCGIRTISESSVPGVDGVYNPVEISNGVDREQDDSLRRRLSLMFASMQRATVDAIKFAAFSVPGVESVVVSENDPMPGYIRVYTADQNGMQPLSTRIAVRENCDNYKAAGITIIVSNPEIRFQQITVDINVVDPKRSEEAKDRIEQMLQDWVNTFGMGDKLIRSEIVAQLHKSPYVFNVPAVPVPPIDIIPNSNEIIRPSAILVRVLNEE